MFSMCDFSWVFLLFNKIKFIDTFISTEQHYYIFMFRHIIIVLNSICTHI